ncbi:MAG TPA: hypothetical protein ENG10_01380, partial [Candidatus Bathyarchaeota archaeon]|nr:hypothetical protein [Candidatus Bathyarchaeota archaeon]HEX68933.1 hypothetical protein [Candidatus Bathyarchaeota archaeon]
MDLVMTARPIILLFVLAVAGFTSTSLARAGSELQQPNVWSFPRVDEIYFREEFGRLTEYDAAWDAWRYVGELWDSGWNFSLLPNRCTWIFAINCRDVTPESSGKFVNYNRTPGFSLYPLNLSEFRRALKIIINSVKEDLIREVYGVEFAFPLGSIISPTDKYWFNPNVVDTSRSVAEAYRILIEAGFSNSSGYWMCPNGQELRQIHIIAPDSPTYIDFSIGIVRQLNSFFGKMSDGKSDYFVVDVPGFPHSAYITYYNRDFDVSFTVCWPGVYPSFLYYDFHTDNDYIGGRNVAGFNNSLLDDLLWMINFGCDPTTGRLLSLEELRDACFNAQLIIKEETPVIPLFGRTRIPAFKPKLAGWNFEFDQKWLYTLTHWKDLKVGGRVNWLVESTNNMEEFVLHPLKPLKRYIQYRYLFDTIFDPLIVFNPYSGGELPWAAIDWKRESWSDTDLNVTDGMKVTFWLRNEMFWHDGVQITAEDVKFCWEYLKCYNAPIFKDVASKLVKVETEGDYIVHAYLNSTSYALIYDLADTALLLPKHLWENVT